MAPALPIRRSQAGAAMITALIVVLITTLFIGAGTLLSFSHYNLAWSQGRSEASLLLAEGGIDDELKALAQDAGGTTQASLSSQPVVGTGETMVYPGESHAVYGRKGFVNGWPNNFYWVCSSNNEWWKSGATPVAWDGKTANFYITSTAYVSGAWRRTEVQASSISLFSLFAICALSPASNNDIILSSAAVTINGTAVINGQLSNSGGSTLTATNAINADTAVNSSGQFTSSNVQTGGTLSSQSNPVAYPSVATVLKRISGLLSDTDAQIWTWLGSNNSNNTKIYTYKSTAQNSTINTTNCVQYNPGITTLTNAAWSGAAYKPGTESTTTIAMNSALSNPTGVQSTTPITINTAAKHNLSTGQRVKIVGATPAAVNGYWTITSTGQKSFTLNGSTAAGVGGGGTVAPSLVQTLIFEPGDYYFTAVGLSYAATNEIVIDTQAFASGGTPGQIRFWIYSSSSGGSNDAFDLQPVVTMATGQTTPDPTYFRIYYSKDGKAFSFDRPAGISDYLGNAITTDFNVYGGVYSATGTAGNAGPQITFTGATGTGNGRIVLNGSLLANVLKFQGPCTVNFLYSNNVLDPSAGAGVTGGYSDGG